MYNDELKINTLYIYFCLSDCLPVLDYLYCYLYSYSHLEHQVRVPH